MRTKRAKNYVLGQPGYPVVQMYTVNVIEQKLTYIQENPVKEGSVFREEDYVYSSALNYCNQMGLIHIDMLN